NRVSFPFFAIKSYPSRCRETSYVVQPACFSASATYLSASQPVFTVGADTGVPERTAAGIDVAPTPFAGFVRSEGGGGLESATGPTEVPGNADVIAALCGFAAERSK